MLILFIVIAFLAAGFIDASLRQKYKIERNKSFSDQFFNKWHMLFEIFVILVFLGLISVMGFAENKLYALLVLFFAFLYMVRTILEFTFRKAQNKYKISMMYVGIFIVLSVGIYFFM